MFLGRHIVNRRNNISFFPPRLKLNQEKASFGFRFLRESSADSSLSQESNYSSTHTARRTCHQDSRKEVSPARTRPATQLNNRLLNRNVIHDDTCRTNNFLISSTRIKRLSTCNPTNMRSSSSY